MLAMVTATALAGCASTPSNMVHGDQRQSSLRPSGDKALVVVMRESMLKGSIGTWAVHMDGREVAHLGTATHAAIELAPGEHFLGGPMVQPTPIRVEADRTYFYNYDIPFTGGQAYELLPEEKARLLLAKSVRWGPGHPRAADL
ncbi:hypothetical protein ACQ859_28350 [Roseateles chitinivorans]|uniref:hypothetical protein n=1 Tax=Roseateles chitinivorans TaxID=2917965 RepID=UPI003D67ED5C